MVHSLISRCPRHENKTIVQYCINDITNSDDCMHYSIITPTIMCTYFLYRDKPPSVGMSVQLEGTLVPSTHPKQPVELSLSDINVLGDCDPQVNNTLIIIVTSSLYIQSYPFKPHTKHSLEYTRQYPHLRSRTNAFSSVLRVRNTATMALHDYFQVCLVFVSLVIH